MSIPSTECQDIMVAYCNTHVEVNTNKAKIIQLETAQESSISLMEHSTEKGLHFPM